MNENYVNKNYVNKNYVGEKGNAIVEFISFLLLAIVPLFAFFSSTTTEATLRLRDEEVFHEVIRIIKSGDNLSESTGVANRYLTLHNSGGSLFVECLVGDCPHRGSRIQILFINGSRKFKTIFEGGLWN